MDLLSGTPNLSLYINVKSASLIKMANISANTKMAEKINNVVKSILFWRIIIVSINNSSVSISYIYKEGNWKCKHKATFHDMFK